MSGRTKSNVAVVQDTKYRSPEAKYLASRGYTEEANRSEAKYLVANGRITSSSGKVNGPGNGVDGARLTSFNVETNTAC